MQWLHHEHIVCACVCLAFKINGSIAIETAIAIAKAYRADRFSAIFSEKKMRVKKDASKVHGKAQFATRKAHIDLRRRHPTICAMNSVIDIVIQTQSLSCLRRRLREKESTDSEKRSRNILNTRNKVSYNLDNKHPSANAPDPKCRHLIVQFTTTTMQYASMYYHL